MKEIPMSLYIADVKTKLKQIVNHPELPPSVIEPLIKNAHYQVCERANKELEEDYIKYSKSVKENKKEEGK